MHRLTSYTAWLKSLGLGASKCRLGLYPLSLAGSKRHMDALEFSAQGQALGRVTQRNGWCSFQSVGTNGDA